MIIFLRICQHLFETDIFFNNVFTVDFNQFNASMHHKSMNVKKKKNCNLSISWQLKAIKNKKKSYVTHICHHP